MDYYTSPNCTKTSSFSSNLCLHIDVQSNLLNLTIAALLSFHWPWNFPPWLLSRVLSWFYFCCFDYSFFIGCFLYIYSTNTYWASAVCQVWWQALEIQWTIWLGPFTPSLYPKVQSLALSSCYLSPCSSDFPSEFVSYFKLLVEYFCLQILQSPRLNSLLPFLTALSLASCSFNLSCIGPFLYALLLIPLPNQY